MLTIGVSGHANWYRQWTRSSILLSNTAPGALAHCEAWILSPITIRMKPPDRFDPRFRTILRRRTYGTLGMRSSSVDTTLTIWRVRVLGAMHRRATTGRCSKRHTSVSSIPA